MTAQSAAETTARNRIASATALPLCGGAGVVGVPAPFGAVAAAVAVCRVDGGATNMPIDPDGS